MGTYRVKVKGSVSVSVGRIREGKGRGVCGYLLELKGVVRGFQTMNYCHISVLRPKKS